MGNIFFTADPHYSHRNIIRMSRRPFDDVDDMNQTMIRNHNSVVSNDDDVFIIGDFMWSSKVAETNDLLGKLRGRKHLIVGNHDRKPVCAASGWASTSSYKEISIDNRKVVLFHYPILEWNGYWHNGLHVHGHVHGNMKPYHERALNAGVDVNGFIPVTLQTLIQNTKARMTSPG